MANYLTDFRAFYRDLFRVEGAYGPAPVIPPFLDEWLGIAFDKATGSPTARTICDFRSKKQGKSALAGSTALFMASRKKYSECYILASDQEQSRDRVLRACKYAVENGPLLDHAKVYKDIIELDNKSIIQALPFDYKGAAGMNPSCVIVDEVHTWIYENFRRLWDEVQIPPTQPEGVRWVASYAGHEGESLLLRDLWDKALAGERLLGDLPIYRNHDLNLLAFVDTGPASWRMPWMNEKYIAEVRASERPNSFKRLWLNEWTTSESQFACRDDTLRALAEKEPARLIVGADASTSRDFTALVGVQYNPDLNTVDVKLVRVWKPKKGWLRGGKPTIDLDETIGAEVIRLHEAGQLGAVVCDPFQLHTSIIEWQKRGIRVIELPQTTGRIEADQGLYDAIVSRGIRHYNEPALNDAIQSCIALETTLKIDAAVALSMAVHGCMTTQKVIGTVAYVPDPFANWPPPEGATWQKNQGWVNNWSYKSHALGITWHNCKRRTKGCEACVNELEAEGYFEAQEEDARRRGYFERDYQPMTEEMSYQRTAEDLGYHPPSPGDQAANNRAARTASLFWKRVINKE
jgi:hypothetical protein